MNPERQSRLLARGENAVVELTPSRQLLVSSGAVSIALDPDDYLDLCGTLLHALKAYRNRPGAPGRQ